MTAVQDATTPADAVYATVCYADVFDMPIELDHLHRYLVGARLSLDEVDNLVDDLVLQERLARREQLVYLPDRPEVLAVWDERTDRAASMWRDAERWGRRIGRLPFVRMVAVTGGLAVDSVADHDDIDYFIVTRPGRLWLTRAMVLLLGRFAARHELDLCPNFIVADTALEMNQQTIYVARELAQMVVIVGPDVARTVRNTNSWMFEQLPNASVDGDMSRASDQKVHMLQQVAERLLLLPPFGWLEHWEMNRKIAMLTSVRSRRPEVGAPDESSFSPDVCKGHMVGNAAGIDVAWRSRLAGSNT